MEEKRISEVSEKGRHDGFVAARPMMMDEQSLEKKSHGLESVNSSRVRKRRRVKSFKIWFLFRRSFIKRTEAFVTLATNDKPTHDAGHRPENSQAPGRRGGIYESWNWKAYK
jgi:hypothetical protein